MITIQTISNTSYTVFPDEDSPVKTIDHPPICSTNTFIIFSNETHYYISFIWGWADTTKKLNIMQIWEPPDYLHKNIEDIVKILNIIFFRNDSVFFNYREQYVTQPYTTLQDAKKDYIKLCLSFEKV